MEAAAERRSHLKSSGRLFFLFLPSWLWMGFIFLMAFIPNWVFANEEMREVTSEAQISRVKGTQSGKLQPQSIHGLSLDIPWTGVVSLDLHSELLGPHATLAVQDTLTPEALVQRWIMLQGTFLPNSANTSLLINVGTYDRVRSSIKIKIDSESRFSVPVPIMSDRSYFDLISVDSFGRISSERFRLDCAGCVNSLVKSKMGGGWQMAPKRLTFSPVIGMTLLSYAETNGTPYSAVLLTPKLGVAYAMTPIWSLHASTFMSAFSFSSSDPNTWMSFLGYNLSVGFTFPKNPNAWKTTLMFGLYSVAIGISTNAQGFDRLSGPQIILSERFSLNPISSFSVYAKYSPLFTGSQFLLSENEIAGGVSYERRLGAYDYNASLDVSAFNYTGGVSQIHLSTFTFGLGMRL